MYSIDSLFVSDAWAAALSKIVTQSFLVDRVHEIFSKKHLVICAKTKKVKLDLHLARLPNAQGLTIGGKRFSKMHMSNSDLNLDGVRCFIIFDSPKI